MPTYDSVSKLFEENGCKLLTTKDTFDALSGRSQFKMKVEFVASCQHPNTVTLTNFMQKKSGLVCKDCMYKSVSKQLKEQHKDKDESIYQEQEYIGIQLLEHILCDEFDVQKTNEGCLADILIKPKYEREDKWGLIQVKTTKELRHDLYTFAFHRNVYSNCLIVCICLSESKLWIFDSKVLSQQDTLNIGRTQKSTFYRYMTPLGSVNERLHYWYAENKKFNLRVGMQPLNVLQRTLNQQQEQDYRRHREKQLSFIEYEYPCIDGRKTDFFVNGFKIQEKVASICKHRKKGFIAHIVRQSTKNTKQTYKVSDNDFYWIWLKGVWEYFYVFPESVLIEKGFFVGHESKRSIFLTDKNWTKDFYYSLEDPTLQYKLQSLFKVNQ